MDIVGIGTPCIDNLSVLDALPSPNQGARIHQFSRQGGGVTATAMVAAARLGAKAGYIGVYGTCVYGRFIAEDFVYNGVDISRCVKHEGAYSDFAHILSDLKTGGRSILYHGGTTRKLAVEDLDKEYIISAKYLHLAACGLPDTAAAEWARAAGRTVVFDAGRYSDGVQNFLPKVDVFIGSEFCFDDICAKKDFCEAVRQGEANKYKSDPAANEALCRAVSALGPEIVAFTLGEKGSIVYSKTEGYFEAPGYTVPVTDTVGAGDVYHGAFIVGMVRGMSPKECAQFSNAVSAVKIGAIGGRAGIPSYKTTMDFMETGKIDRAEIDERVAYYQHRLLFG
jgi:sulfofructose kinase